VNQLVGIALVILLAALYALALRSIIRAPFRALGVLVAGMAVHNFVLMILLRLGTPGPLVRVAQAWKEGLLLVLLGLVLLMGYRRWIAGRMPKLRLMDLLMIALTAVVLVYFLVPASVLHGQASFSQRVLGLRVLILIPLLYLFGRVFPARQRSDLAWVAGLLLGSAALVGVFGTIELWFIPTRRWLDWGVNGLSAWLGFTYHGPAGLPENFFQTTAEGYLLRRLVSTYVSPLGAAYTGLLIVPIGVVLLFTRRALPRLPWWFAAVMLDLLLLGIFFSVTRLALAALVGEFALLYILLRRRSLILHTLLVAGAVLFMIYGFPRFGPLLDRSLQPVAHRGSVHIASSSDPSAREHLAQLINDLDFVRHHPLGAGLGSSIHRFGPTSGTGESAVFDVFGDVGAVGGLLYIVIYLAGMGFAGRAFYRVRTDPLQAALPLTALVGGLALVPITLTSDVWSDFSVTFLFWWAVGYSVTLAAGTTTANSSPRPEIV
jgi:hypothetical protein